MYKTDDFTKDLYKVSELAKILDKSVQTIQNYIRQGKLLSIKDSENYAQLVTKESILDYLKSIGNLYLPEKNQSVLIVENLEQVNEFLKYNRIKKIYPYIIRQDNIEELMLQLITLITNENIEFLYIFSTSFLNETIFELIKNLCNQTNTEMILFKKEGNYNDARTK